ncbi:MAG: argininosuccinate synthase [Vicinamibacterales bacterium]|nr:argininosuccinate synthase [Vicinamibacterales bacterium]
MRERVVVVCAGPGDPGEVVRALAAVFPGEIVALTLDLGDGEAAARRDRALGGGACRCHVVDAREALADGVVLPSLRAQALGPGGAPLTRELAQVAVARALVDVAGLEQALTVAHDSVGDEAARLDALVQGLAPSLAVLAPLAAAALPDERITTALWGRTITGPAVTGPWSEASGAYGRLVRTAARTPAGGAVVAIRFEAGAPVAVNGVEMPFVELIASLDTIAGGHGVGRGATRAGGGWHLSEAPAAVVLHQAHAALLARVTPPDAQALAHGLSVKYADLIARGAWFTPLREALDAEIAAAQPAVTGTVHVRLAGGESEVVACEAAPALYDEFTRSQIADCRLQIGSSQIGEITEIARSIARS